MLTFILIGLHGDSQSKLDECVKRSLSCAKFLLYTTLFPEHRVATELTEDRVELLRAFTKHFDLQIASQNLHECLAQLEYRIVAAVLKIDRDVESKEKVSAHYIFDKMEYYSSAEIAVFHHVRYGKMIGITVRLPNDGFLYGENDNFALKRPTTIDHTAHQW